MLRIFVSLKCDRFPLLEEIWIRIKVWQPQLAVVLPFTGLQLNVGNFFIQVLLVSIWRVLEGEHVLRELDFVIVLDERLQRLLLAGYFILVAASLQLLRWERAVLVGPVELDGLLQFLNEPLLLVQFRQLHSFLGLPGALIQLQIQKKSSVIGVRRQAGARRSAGEAAHTPSLLWSGRGLENKLLGALKELSLSKRWAALSPLQCAQE